MSQQGKDVSLWDKRPQMYETSEEMYKLFKCQST